LPIQISRELAGREDRFAVTQVIYRQIHHSPRVSANGKTEHAKTARHPLHKRPAPDHLEFSLPSHQSCQMTRMLLHRHLIADELFYL
jgi:hypothetical protein